ncbi:hypothetical protein [Streptomyces sp. UG1]|uniref:hypothetical protein n=1 Tax=Streptomyces sp. UG1 TaxID=3417652 RepID=UPI003CE8BA30
MSDLFIAAGGGGDPVGTAITEHFTGLAHQAGVPVITPTPGRLPRPAPPCTTSPRTSPPASSCSTRGRA